MKRSSSLSVLRWLLILTSIIGLLLLLVFSLPFETVAGWLNGLASDGSFETFTVERHQALSRLSWLIGLILVAFPALALIRWADTQRVMEKLGGQIRELIESLRNDTHVFIDGLSFASWSRSDLVLMTGLVIVALILRLANLYLPLSHDEAYMYNAFASRPLWVTVSDYHLPNNHVLLAILINILTHVFGNHLWLIRLPTIIAGILMVPAAYVLGRRWYGREAGMLSAGLVAVFPILVEYSVLARGYAFVNLFTLLILIFGDQVRENKNRFVWLLIVIFNALGFYTIPIMMFPFGALYIWLFVSCMIGDIHGYLSKFDFFQYWLVSGFASAFLTLLLYSPIVITNPANFFGNSFVTPLRTNVFPVVFQSRMEVAWFDWMHTIPDWLIFASITGLALGLLFHFKIAAHKIPLQLTFFIWIAFYLIYRRPDIMTRMWLYLAAPLLIWSAGGLTESLRWFSSSFHRKPPLVQIFLGVSLASVFLYGVLNVPTIPVRWSEKSSVERAAQFFKDTLHEGDLVTASVEYFPQLRYYFGVYGVDQDYLRKSGYFQRAFIVLGDKRQETLEDVVPKMGRKSDRPAVIMETLRIVLKIENLTVYEGDPAPQ